MEKSKVAEDIAYVTSKFEQAQELIDSMEYDEMLDAYGAAQYKRRGFRMDENISEKAKKFAEVVASVKDDEIQSEMIFRLSTRGLELLEQRYPPTEEALRKCKEWWDHEMELAEKEGR